MIARALGGVLVLLAACHGDRAPVPVPRHAALPVANLDVVWHGPIADLPHVPAVAPDVDVRADGADLVGVDPATHATRWRIACNDMAGDAPCSGRIARSGDLAIYAGTIAYRARDISGGLFAVDVRTGRERWRVPAELRDEYALDLVVDAQRAYALSWGQLFAFDLATGAPAWTRATDLGAVLPTKGTLLAVRDGVLAFADSAGAIHLADPATGRDRARIPVEHFVGGIALRDGALYVLPGLGSGPETVAAYDAQTGRERWRHDEAAVWAVPPMFVDDDALYFRRSSDSTLALNDTGTEVVALDRATGTVVWQRSIGRARSLAMVAAPDSAPMIVVETPTEAIEFARQAAPARPAEATISGSVSGPDPGGRLDGLRVQVGDALAVTDARGAFTADVRAIGAVPVTLLDMPRLAAPAREPLYAEPAFVNVDPLARSYRSDIVVHERPPPD